MNASPTTVHELTMLLTELRERSEQLEAAIAAVRQQITAVRMTIQLCASETIVGTDVANPLQNFQPLLVPLATNSWVEKLRGMKHMEALYRIAQENQGTIKVTEAREIMIEAGLITGKRRNAASHLFHLLDDSPLYEKIAPGTYQLIDWEPIRPEHPSTYGISKSA